MEISNLITRARVLIPAALMLVTLNSFSQQVQETPEIKRPEVLYKQVHSSTLSKQSENLFADGLKLKLDLSVLDDAEAEREFFNPDDIPADDVYGGLWENRYVKMYKSIKRARD